MKRVYVLGKGQLGCMLHQAGEQLGIDVWLIGSNTDPKIIQFQQNIITTEIEHWPENIPIYKLTRCDEFVNRDIFPIVTDRLKQKMLLDNLRLPTVPWRFLIDKSEWPIIFNTFGSTVIVKNRVGSYDGHGQWFLQRNEINKLPDYCYGKCIVEQKINFSNEISLIGARDYDGNIVFYPLTYNLHRDSILRISIVFPDINIKQQEESEAMLSTIMEKLNYVGVMAMECFVTSTGLLINELAPRVHNSGHWTQDGASISQFELHLRAIIGLPIPSPIVNNPSVMINLIGTDLNYDWLKLSLVHLHWYKKEVLPGRKVGHLNLNDNNINRLHDTMKAIIPLLPPEYANNINWAQSNLKNRFSIAF